MPVASAFHGLFSDLPVLTVQTNCAFDAKSYDAPKNDIPSPNAVDPQEDDDGPPVLEPIRGGASWMISEPVLSPIPSMKGDQPAPLAEHITFKPTMLSPIPPLTIGPPLLSSPYDDCYSPSSSGYSSADSRCSFFVPSTAAFRSASVLSLPTLPFERLQHGLFNQSAFTPWRNRLPTFHDYPFQQPVAPSTDAFRPASTECSSMTCSTPLSATSFSAFGTHTLLHRSPPFFAANSPLSSDEASSSGISSASSSFSDHSDHGRDHIGVHGYARQRPPTSTPPVAKVNATQESPPIIRPEPVWPTAVSREPRIETDVQPPVLEKCEPIGDDERVVRRTRQSDCTPLSDNESPKSETRSSGERSGICMVESLPTIMKTVDNEMERPQTARSSVSDVMLAPPEMPTPTSPAIDTSQLRVSPLKIRIPSRNADRDNKDEPAAKSPKLARNSLRKQPAVEERPAICRKKSSASRMYGRNVSLKRNSLESSASEGSLEDASELTNRAQDFHMDHIDQPSPSTSSDYYLSKESAIPTTPTKRDSFDSDSQKENYDDFRWPPYNMRVRKQSNPSTPVKKPLSKLIRKASTASQKRKESIKETTNVPQPHSPRKRRNSLRPTKFRSNWTPADQGTYQPVILALDAPPVQKLCYEAIRHNRENVVIHVRDCVKVCSSEGLENVGKIMRLYFDKIEKTLMASILWYYTPAQLDPRCTKSLDDSALRSFQVQEKELLASRHVDNVAVDAIESVAYVLTFNQYCRYKAEVRWKEQFGMPVELTPNAPRETFGYRRTYRLPDETTDPEVVYFCRAVYNLSHKRIRVMPKPQLPLKTKPPSRRGSSNTKMSAGKTAFVV